MNDERDQAYYENQSKEFRQKYQQAQKGSQSTNSDPEKEYAQNIMIIILIIYSTILITFVLLLYQVASFRYFCFGLLQTMNDEGPYIGAFLIGLIGYWFVLTGFNVVLYDIMAGFLIKPFWFALFAVSLAKYLAKYTGFLCGRYLIRDFVYIAMNENQYFIVSYLATERKPLKVMFLLQFLAVPTIFKTYACGLFRITHFEYLFPTFFGTVIWCSFWVYLGSQLETIADTLTTGDTSQYVPLWLKLVMGVIVIIIIIYFFKLTKQIYQEIQSDASLAELSHIIEREEEEANLINQAEGQEGE